MAAPAFSVASLRSTRAFQVRARARVSMVNKKSGRKAPVVLAKGLSLRRRRKRGRVEMLDAQALAAPVPGTLLVLLSRLHRCEDPVFDGEPRVVVSEDPLPGESAALSPRDPDL